jgi:hypothetical protein
MVSAVSVGTLLLAACSQPSATGLSGIWRADETLAGKNLVIEFVSDGTGKVFSGSIIGLPADGAFEWDRKGDQIRIETVADDPVVQALKIRSQTDSRMLVRVNQSEIELQRVDGLIDEDAVESLP